MLYNFIIFPKTTVPLNIFEPRYVDMINDSIKSDKLIGMVQPKITKKNETIEPELYQIGCLGKITSFKETEDGRFFALVLKEEIKEFLPKFNDIKIKLENAWKQTKAIEETLNLAGELSSSNDFIKFANKNQMNVSQIIGASQNDPSYPRPQIIKSLFFQ